MGGACCLAINGAGIKKLDVVLYTPILPDIVYAGGAVR